RATCAGIFVVVICLVFSRYAAFATIDATADIANAAANMIVVAFFMVRTPLKQDECLAGAFLAIRPCISQSQKKMAMNSIPLCYPSLCYRCSHAMIAGTGRGHIERSRIIARTTRRQTIGVS